jgi:hypothetical protein
MDKEKARAELAHVMAQYRQKSYADWVARIRQDALVLEVKGAEGREYQIEIEAFWDDSPSGNVRVLFSIDDGGWSAFSPVCDSFLIAADGTSAGE